MKAIVITTIFPPTAAAEAFARMEGYQMYVVGDRKTPAGWGLPETAFISAVQQEQMPYRLIRHLPWNHYCRKMIGYLKAMEEGAECLADTDDDNIPKSGWGFPPFRSSYRKSAADSGFVNVYSLFTSRHIWPRGLPLNRITSGNITEDSLEMKDCTVGVWQGLADEDPDVDAVYRLTDNKPCYFREHEPVVLGKGTISPFNTQNTLFCKELFPLLYLPGTVTFRFTDILRGLVAQPVMWQHGYELGFIGATVVQKRNPHDYMKDFLSEIPMYTHSENVIDIVSSSLSASDSVAGNLFRAYEALAREEVVMREELDALSAWLYDVSAIK